MGVEQEEKDSLFLFDGVSRSQETGGYVMRRNALLGCFVILMGLTGLPLFSYAGFFDDVMTTVVDSVNKDLGDQQNQESQSGNSSQQAGKFAIGDEHSGGIIFFIDDSGEHGLVASDTDIRGTRSWDESITACKNYKKNNHNDWFLPNRDQLAELYLRRSVVGGWAPKSAYWSSTKSDIRDCAWLQYFSTGSQYKNFTTNYLHYARCVRAF